MCTLRVAVYWLCWLYIVNTSSLSDDRDTVLNCNHMKWTSTRGREESWQNRHKWTWEMGGWNILYTRILWAFLWMLLLSPACQQPRYLSPPCSWPLFILIVRSSNPGLDIGLFLKPKTQRTKDDWWWFTAVQSLMPHFKLQLKVYRLV